MGYRVKVCHYIHMERKLSMGVFKKNGFYWIDYYDAAGKRRRKKISPSKEVATKALREVQVRVSKEEYLGAVGEKRTTFSEFAKVYLEWARANLGETTYERCQGIIEKHLSPAFDTRLTHITNKMVEEYKTTRTKQVKPATVNREMSRLRHMLGMAVKWDYIRENPSKGVKELREPAGRVRYLEPEEYQKLLEACSLEALLAERRYGKRKFSKLLSVYLRPIVELAANTGMRRGELMSLRRKDIDMKGRRITLEMTKNGERRLIPMNARVADLLKGLPPRIDSEMLFPGISGDAVTHAFKRAVVRAGLDDFHFHDLRHCFASHLTMQGVDLRSVMSLMGHKDLRMTVRYSHLSPAHLQDAVNTLGKVFNAGMEKAGDNAGSLDG